MSRKEFTFQPYRLIDHFCFSILAGCDRGHGKIVITDKESEECGMKSCDYQGKNISRMIARTLSQTERARMVTRIAATLGTISRSLISY